MNRLANIVAWVLVSVLATLVLSEALLRVFNPPPRRGVFRPKAGYELTDVDGVPVWFEPHEEAGPRGAAQRDDGCDPASSFRVLVVGDSITWGVLVEPHEMASAVFAAQLRQELGGRACVRNISAPGQSLYQLLARATREVATYRPHVVAIELWGGPPRTPVRRDDTVYLLEGSPDEAPALLNPWLLPPWLNDGLLRRSRLYEYTVLALDNPHDHIVPPLAPHRPLLDGFVDAVEAQGGHVVTWMAAFLDHPFDAQPPGVLTTNRELEVWLGERGVRNVRAWEAWVGEDPSELGLDVCHLSVAGNQKLAETWRALVAPELEAWRAAQLTSAPGTPPSP